MSDAPVTSKHDQRAAAYRERVPAPVEHAIDLGGTGTGCIASDLVTIDALPIRYMKRMEPSSPLDSGWLFASGFESPGPDDYAVWHVNDIANLEPEIVELLGADIGAEFEKVPGATRFSRVES